MRDANHIDNIVAIAMTTEVIVSKIHIINKAYRLREADILSISFIDTILPSKVVRRRS